MDSLVVAGIVSGCAFGGAMLGMELRRRLPEDHLSPESRDVVRQAMGLVASIAALVLGLLVASASSNFGEEKSGFEDMAANISLLDRSLAQLGEKASTARDDLKRTTELLVEKMWPPADGPSLELDSQELTASGARLAKALREMPLANDVERGVQTQALEIGLELAKTRWRLSQKEHDESLPRPFLIVLTFWLTVLFVGFGLFSVRNATVICALFLCAVSVGTALFLVVDLDQPLDGLIQLSSVPLRKTLADLGQ